MPSEKQFTKTVNSAFIGTGLTEYLHEQGIDSLVVVGLTTHHCISTSVRMAANLDFDVILVADATAVHERVGYDGVHYSAEQIHKINRFNRRQLWCFGNRNSRNMSSEIEELKTNGPLDKGGTHD